jgi:uncharacterized protein
MNMKPLQHMTLALAVIPACVRVEPVQQTPTPRAGSPQQELAVLEGEYSFSEKKCMRTAEEVVDMQRRCSATQWADCVYSATMYYRGCGVTADRAQADALFQRACGFGSILGCSMAGVLERDVERGIELLQKPCALGYLAACGNIGIKLFNRGNQADVERATELLDRACREEHVYYCGTLGKIVRKWKLTPRFAATQGLLEHACQERDLDSCYMLALVLDEGSLGIEDRDRAAELNWAACHQLDYLPSCNSLGYMLVQGHGYPKDEQKGAMLFYVGCNRGYGPSCDSMGEATEKGWGGPASPAKAVPFYDKGCELGFEDACQHARALRAAGTEVGEPTGN